MLGGDKSLVPELKTKKAPKPIAMVDLTVLVLGEKAPYGLRIEDPAGLDSVGG